MCEYLFGWLALYETIAILDRFQLISDQSGHLLILSILLVNHRCMNATLLNSGQM